VAEKATKKETSAARERMLELERSEYEKALQVKRYDYDRRATERRSRTRAKGSGEEWGIKGVSTFRRRERSSLTPTMLGNFPPKKNERRLLLAGGANLSRELLQKTGNTVKPYNVPLNNETRKEIQKKRR